MGRSAVSAAPCSGDQGAALNQNIAWARGSVTGRTRRLVCNVRLIDGHRAEARHGVGGASGIGLSASLTPGRVPDRAGTPATNLACFADNHCMGAGNPEDDVESTRGFEELRAQVAAPCEPRG